MDNKKPSALLLELNMIYPSISQYENKQRGLLKLEFENLFIKLEQIEKDLKRYNKLKH